MPQLCTTLPAGSAFNIPDYTTNGVIPNLPNTDLCVCSGTDLDNLFNECYNGECGGDNTHILGYILSDDVRNAMQSWVDDDGYSYPTTNCPDVVNGYVTCSPDGATTPTCSAICDDGHIYWARTDTCVSSTSLCPNNTSNSKKPTLRKKPHPSTPVLMSSRPVQSTGPMAWHTSVLTLVGM